MFSQWQQDIAEEAIAKIYLKDFDFSNIIFPIVRRVFGGLTAQELISVQPMSMPSGLMFHLDYSYGDSRTWQEQVFDQAMRSLHKL